MALTITKVPDCGFLAGQSQRIPCYQLAPGVSDYPAGGYPITSDDVEMEFIFGAWIIAQNDDAQHLYPVFVFPDVAFTPIPPAPMPQKTIYLQVKEIVSSGQIYAFSELSQGDNISGFFYWAYVVGY